MNFDREMESRVKETEAILKAYLPDESGWARTVMEAMNYSVNAGGKRLRPILMAETYRLFGGTDNRAVYGSDRDDPYVFTRAR